MAKSNHEWAIVGHFHVTEEQLLTQQAILVDDLCDPMPMCMRCERSFSESLINMPCEEPAAYLPTGEPIYASEN